MNNNGVSIFYGDFALNAKENFQPFTTDRASFSKEEQINELNVYFANYGNPCELYSVVLDGNSDVFPDNSEDKGIGWWSNQLSDENGYFDEPIVLDLFASSGYYTSPGFTFTFDRYNNIYPTNINIQWYQNDDLLAEQTFSPDNFFYFCNLTIKNYNRIIVTINRLNMPYNRLKMYVVDYGYGTTFTRDMLRDVKIIQEINPIGTSLPVGICDFVVDSKSNIEYSFQEYQTLKIYFDGKLKATTFITDFERLSKQTYKISSEDYVGILGYETYYGRVFLPDKLEVSAYETFEHIFKICKVPYHIDDSFKNIILNGCIPTTSGRMALQQLCFATNAIVNTVESEVVNVIPNKIPEKSQKISSSRILQGQTVETEENLTGLDLSRYEYIDGKEYVSTDGEIRTKFTDSVYVGDLDVGQHLVTWNSAIQAYKVTTNTTKIKIDIPMSSGALITVKEKTFLDRVTFYYAQQSDYKIYQIRKDNLLSDRENVAKIDNMTLVNIDNRNNIAYRCLDWLTKTKKTTTKIVEGKHLIKGKKAIYGMCKYGELKYKEKQQDIVIYDEPVNLGDVITVDTEYLGEVTGRVIKQTYNLNGNNIVKEVVIR